MQISSCAAMLLTVFGGIGLLLGAAFGFGPLVFSSGGGSGAGGMSGRTSTLIRWVRRSARQWTPAEKSIPDGARRGLRGAPLCWLQWTGGSARV